MAQIKLKTWSLARCHCFNANFLFPFVFLIYSLTPEGINSVKIIKLSKISKTEKSLTCSECKTGPFTNARQKKKTEKEEMYFKSLMKQLFLHLLKNILTKCHEQQGN